MRKSTLSLRATTLLSLIGLSAQQSTSSAPTWGEPFTVDNSATNTVIPTSAAGTESTEALLPATTQHGPLITDSLPAPTLSASISGTDTVVSGLQSVVSADSTFDLSSSGLSLETSVFTSTSTESVTESGSVTPATTSSQSGPTTNRLSATGSQSTGAAAAVVVLGGDYMRMGFVGALAGAAGVVFA